jgi:hypothetical protein
MSEERPVDLNFLAEQQQSIIADQRLMMDELHVQGAIVRRLDNSQSRDYCLTSCVRSVASWLASSAESAPSRIAANNGASNRHRNRRLAPNRTKRLRESLAG